MQNFFSVRNSVHMSAHSNCSASAVNAIATATATSATKSRTRTSSDCNCGTPASTSCQLYIYIVHFIALSKLYPWPASALSTANSIIQMAKRIKHIKKQKQTAKIREMCTWKRFCVAFFLLSFCAILVFPQRSLHSFRILTFERCAVMKAPAAAKRKYNKLWKTFVRRQHKSALKKWVRNSGIQ